MTYGAYGRKLQAALVGTVAIVTTIAALWFTGAAAESAANSPTPPDTVRLVAFGDSLSAGYGLPSGDAFPVKLEAALRAKGHDVAIANAGVSGDTASGGLSRVDWSVPEGTDGVILELGANDALRGVDLAVTREALGKIAARLDERGIPVLVAGMLAPPNMGTAYAETFNAIFPDLAQRHDFILYPFFLDGVATDPTRTLDDGMHPNAQGVDAIVARILPYVERLIARIGQTSRARSDG